MSAPHGRSGRSDGSDFRRRGFFVTGTDTGVGKTLIACALLRAYGAAGVRAAGFKPVAAGALREGSRLLNDDVQALQAAAGVEVEDRLANPYCFEPPIAPHIAAAEAGVSIDRGRLLEAYAGLEARAEAVVVEGAGGFRVPLGDAFDSADLAAALGLPVVLVVGMRLGCLNHALLTAAAIDAAGLTLAGWVANHVDPAMSHKAENVAALEARLHAPLLARIEYDPAADASRAAPVFADALARDRGVALNR